MKTPTGFVRRRVGGRTTVLRPELEDALTQLGFLDGEATREPAETVGGRRPHPVYTLPGESGSVLWKRCRRGGWVARFLGDRHRSEARFLRELELSARARQVGLRVAEALALAVETSGGGWKRVELILKKVPGARDLEAALLENLSPRVRRGLLRETAATLRRFHRCGFLHGDLNLKNVLWREAAGALEVTLIDLDPGSSHVPRVGRSPRGNLLRLYRSYLKGERRARWCLSRTDRWRFVRTYFSGDERELRRFWKSAERLRSRRRWTGALRDRIRGHRRPSQPPRGDASGDKPRGRPALRSAGVT